MLFKFYVLMTIAKGLDHSGANPKRHRSYTNWRHYDQALCSPNSRKRFLSERLTTVSLTYMFPDVYVLLKLKNLKLINKRFVLT